MSRPRSVPEEEALEQALLLFWEKGFDRTSIADLSEAIGVGPSSIYNSFGSKDELFRRSIERYMGNHTAFAEDIRDGTWKGDTEQVIREFLRGAARAYTSKDLPPGCALFQSGGAGSPEDSKACAFTMEFKRGLEKALLVLLKKGKDEGQALSASPRVLSKFLVGMLRGMSQLACDGTSRQDLLKIADHAARSCVA